MSLTRRGKSGVWWVSFTAPNGRRIRRSTRTANRKQAQEYEANLKSELWRVYKLGEKPKYTWDQAVVRWVREKKDKVSISDDVHHLRWVDPYLRGIKLHEINRDHIDFIIQKRLEDGVANATVNRLLEVIRAILRRAQTDWEWIDHTPTIRLLPRAKRRIRWLTRAEADRVLDELRTLPHLRAMVAFSLATGLREANVTLLEWSQVDLEQSLAWIHADQSKSGRAITVPLNADAMRVLRQQLGKHPVRVFVFKGKPIRKANTKAWRKALDRAGIKPHDDGLLAGSVEKRYPSRPLDEYKYQDFRWHDLRHTWASWHVQSGTPLYVLQELGGWAGPEMVQRYAHLNPRHLAEFATNIERSNRLEEVNSRPAGRKLNGLGTNLAQIDQHKKSGKAITALTA